MDEETTGLKLLEPDAPEALVPEPLVQPWMIGVILVLAGVLVALWLARKRNPAPVDPRLVREAAFREALLSLKGIDAQDARAAAVQTSLVLRRYLAQAAGDPALYETHEEFLARHESLSILTPDARTAAAAGFSQLAALKYAPDLPDQPPAETVAEARSLLETIHQGFPG
jgi:hypothetical protein